MRVHQRNLPRVVIIGGGFGGLEAAKALRKAEVRVTLLDRQNHHVFQPLLYQVATAALSPADIAEPLRRILRKQQNTEVLLGEVQRIDVAAKKVLTREEGRCRMIISSSPRGRGIRILGRRNGRNSRRA
jgi:NADH dehydrogenase